MATINLTRIDDRLIHGQVMQVWSKGNGTNTIYVVDDDTAKDAFMKAASDPFLQDIDFIGKDVDGAAQIEGFLLPGTYRLDTEADETMIIMTMLGIVKRRSFW